MAFMCGEGGWSLAGHQCGGRNGRCTGTHFELSPNSIGFFFFRFYFSQCLQAAGNNAWCLRQATAC